MAQSTNLKQQLPPPYEMRLIDIVRDRMKSQVGIDTVYNDEKKQILDTIDEQSKLLHSSCMFCCKMATDILISRLEKDPDFNGFRFTTCCYGTVIKVHW